LRTSTFARAGIALTASALAISLGAGPASAADTSSATAAAAAPAPVESAATITGFSIRSGVITNAASTYFPGTVTVGNVTQPTTTAQTEVRVNGRYRGRAALGPNGANIPRQYGSGKVRLGPTYFSDGTTDGAVSNVFYARKQIRSSATYPLKIRRVNGRVTFRAYNVKIVDPSTGRYKSVKRVKLQQLKGSTWKTKKTIKLNSSGTGKYKTSIKKKYRYRLYIPRTATQEKFATVKTGKI
jgi:uncharacterized lipoprotein YbaY